MSDTEPISSRPRAAAGSWTLHSSEHGGNDRCAPGREPAITAFNRAELTTILDMYGRKVAAGEWRDYALDMGREKAVFSIFRRTSEVPLYRVEKNPKLARKQGMYAVIAAGGMILKRGADLKRVLQVLDKTLRVVG